MDDLFNPIWDGRAAAIEAGIEPNGHMPRKSLHLAKGQGPHVFRCSVREYQVCDCVQWQCRATIRRCSVGPILKRLGHGDSRVHGRVRATVVTPRRERDTNRPIVRKDMRTTGVGKKPRAGSPPLGIPRAATPDRRSVE